MQPACSNRFSTLASAHTTTTTAARTTDPDACAQIDEAVRIMIRRRDDGIVHPSQCTHEILDFIETTSPELRARTIKAYFHDFKSLTKADLDRVLAFLASGAQDECHLELFRLALHSHPNAFSIQPMIDHHGAVAEILEPYLAQTSADETFLNLIRASGNDEVFLDGVFRAFRLLGEYTLLSSLSFALNAPGQDSPRPAIGASLLLRWLNIEAPISVHAMLLEHLLPVLPAGCEGQVMDLISSCADPDDRERLLHKLCIDKYHFPRVTSGNHESLKVLVQTVTGAKGADASRLARNPANDNSEVVRRFVQLLHDADVVSAAQIEARTGNT